MRYLSPQELDDALKTLKGWKYDGGELVREWMFPGFPEAIAFVQTVAEWAEAANHHPDIDIRYNKVRLGLVTHDAGGITQKDVDLARQIVG